MQPVKYHSLSKWVFLILVILMSPSYSIEAGIANDVPIVQKKERKMERKKLEHQLGRKLKFKERVALWVLKKQQKRKQAPIHPRAFWAFIVSLSWVLFPVLILPASIIAIVMGFSALGAINKSSGKKGGRGLALAAIVIGIASLALIAVVIGLLAAGGLT